MFFSVGGDFASGGGGGPRVPPSVSSTEECTDFLPVISIFSFTNPGSTLH